MNLRFPEIFGLLIFVATLCSFALPMSASGRIANSMHFVFSPVTGPVQWVVGGRVERDADAQPTQQPIVSDQGGELANLREENRRLRAYVETLTGQLTTIARREAEQGVIGRDVRETVRTVRVIGADAGGRDVLRLAGTSGTAIEVGDAVVARGSLVGKIESLGLANSGAAVRLISDRGVRVAVGFGRFEQAADGSGAATLAMLAPEPRVLVGMGHGELRVENLPMADLNKMQLRVGDVVVLTDSGPTWPIAVHGLRVGLVSYVGESREQPGVAEVRVRPDDLMSLREVGVVKKDEG